MPASLKAYRSEATAPSRWTRWARGILDARRGVLAVMLGLTVFWGWQASRLRPEWNEQAELSADDPQMVQFRQFIERFGGQEWVMVVLRTENVFAPDFLRYLRDVTEKLRDVPHAVGTVSLATVPAVRGRESVARIEPYFREPPETIAEAEALREEVLAHPAWVGTLVSADGTTACIDVMLPALNADANQRIESVEAVRDVLRRNPQAGIQTYVTGLSPLTCDMLDAVGTDIIRFLCLTPPLIVGCLFWAFRTWRGVWVPVLAIAMATVWAMGMLGAGVGTLNICTTMLPTLVAVNGLSYAIHMINACHETGTQGGDCPDTRVQALAHAMPALSMAVLTTAVGFGVQVVSEFRSLRQLGLYSAMGILAAGLLCLTLIPALLSYSPLPGSTAHRRRSLRFLRRGLVRISAIVNRDVWKIPAVLVVLLVLASAGVGRIRVESQWSRQLPESAPSIRGLRVAEEHLAGFYVLELELESAPGAFAEPWALRELDRVNRYVAGLPGVDAVVSINDFLQALHGARDPAAVAGSLPETAGQIAEYRLLYSVSGHEALADSYLTADAGAARTSVRIRSMSTADHLRLVEDIERFAARSLDPRIALRTTGVVKLYAVKLHALIRSVAKSFGLTVLLMAGLMSLQTRSLRAGICAMIPNVLPVALGFGLMGFAGIPLSGSTVMVASVGIGIAVDDTIHFLLRYRRELAGGRAPAAAVRRTLLGTGRAMVFSTLGLAAGFSALACSNFELNREFGLLTAFILSAALLCDLFATPYLARAFRLFQRENP